MSAWYLGGAEAAISICFMLICEKSGTPCMKRYGQAADISSSRAHWFYGVCQYVYLSVCLFIQCDSGGDGKSVGRFLGGSTTGGVVDSWLVITASSNYAMKN